MKIKFLLFCLLLTFGLTQNSFATLVSYNSNDLGGGQWEYDYSVTNDTLATDIEEFTVYFDFGLYDNLMVTTPLADWDELVVNPDLIFGFPEDGFYDALAMVSGIAPGATTSGFSVSFDWLGSGTPGSQFFEVVDPTTWNVLDSGETIAASAPVPEPGTLVLLSSGLAGLVAVRRKFRK